MTRRLAVTAATIALALTCVSAAADGSPPVTVPSTSPEPAPCGIDAAADPCASPIPIYSTPVAGKSVRPLLGFFGLLILVVVVGWYSLREPEEGP